MLNGEKIKKLFFQRLVDSIGNPLEWSTVNKCLLIVCFWTLTALAVTVSFHFFVRHPEAAPFFDRIFMEGMIPFGWGIVGSWIVLLVLGLRLRYRSPDNRAFAYATLLLWWSVESLAAISAGPLTTPQGLMLLGQGFVGFLLFDASIVMVGLAWALLLLVSSTVAAQYGLIPYAPLIAHPLYDGEKLASLWARVMGGTYLFESLMFLSLFSYIISCWRDRESRLAEMTTLIKKTFGRYLSEEVMNTIIERPDSIKLGGEKRKVTMMMSDLRGFTQMSERLEPEKVMALLNRYFDVMMRICKKYHGTINDIFGDALLVTFGAPQERKDHVQNAVACAIEMQNAMQLVNEESMREGSPELEMGIGLNTDEVVVGNIGTEERAKFGVVGSGVNMTSRIESYTVGGQILISESVRREVGEILRVDSQREVIAKGSEAPLKIFEIGGIGSPYNLALEGKDPDMVTLAQNISLHYAAVGGKDVGKDQSNGFISCLSKKSAEVEMEKPLDLLSNIMMNLVDVTEELASKDFYGKVIERISGNEKRYIVRFTSTPPEVAAYFQALRQYGTKGSSKKSV
jgi:class 3 adenylate cyclase